MPPIWVMLKIFEKLGEMLPRGLAMLHGLL